jgi:hypothetical protein
MVDAREDRHVLCLESLLQPSESFGNRVVACDCQQPIVRHGARLQLPTGKESLPSQYNRTIQRRLRWDNVPFRGHRIRPDSPEAFFDADVG